MTHLQRRALGVRERSRPTSSPASISSVAVRVLSVVTLGSPRRRCRSRPVSVPVGDRGSRSSVFSPSWHAFEAEGLLGGRELVARVRRRRRGSGARPAPSPVRSRSRSPADRRRIASLIDGHRRVLGVLERRRRSLSPASTSSVAAVVAGALEVLVAGAVEAGQRPVGVGGLGDRASPRAGSRSG